MTAGRDELTVAEVGDYDAAPTTSVQSPMGEVAYSGYGLQTGLRAGVWRRTAVKAFGWTLIGVTAAAIVANLL